MLLPKKGVGNEPTLFCMGKAESFTPPCSLYRRSLLSRSTPSPRLAAIFADTKSPAAQNRDWRRAPAPRTTPPALLKLPLSTSNTLPSSLVFLIHATNINQKRQKVKFCAEFISSCGEKRIQKPDFGKLFRRLFSSRERFSFNFIPRGSLCGEKNDVSIRT